MQHHLEPFARDLMRFAREERDIVDQAALLWRMIHFVILKYQEKFTDWIYVRHEDLSRDPSQGSGPFSVAWVWTSRRETERASPRIRLPVRPDASMAAVIELERDSLANIDTWKTRLSRGRDRAREKPRVGHLERSSIRMRNGRSGTLA